MAAIELPSRNCRMAAVPDPPSARCGSKTKPVLCLPKGLVDPGEKPLEAALREVREETGITAVPITKLGDSKYVYVRSWGDGEKVFKIVSFYLLRYESGRIDDVSDAMRVEVARAKWVPPRRCSQTPRLSAAKNKWPARRWIMSAPTQNCDYLFGYFASCGLSFRRHHQIKGVILTGAVFQAEEGILRGAPKPPVLNGQSSPSHPVTPALDKFLPNAITITSSQFNPLCPPCPLWLTLRLSFRGPDHEAHQ